MIVGDEQQRVMRFIETVNRGGYRPTGREVNEWRVRPDARAKQRGRLLEAAVPAVPDRRVYRGSSWWETSAAEMFSSQLGGIAQLLNSSSILDSYMKADRFGFMRSIDQMVGFETIDGRPGRPARYAPDRPAEKFLAHLRRLGWIERDDRKRYGVTLLGQALLRAESSVESGDEGAPVIVLSAEDDLAYGRVLGLIAECGEALIVDPYLDAQELFHILKDSNASRFLVGNRLSKGRIARLSILVRTAPSGENDIVREIRQSSFHDRYVVGEHEVYGLGSSLNGVGKNMTTLVELPESAARVVRAEVESLWDGANVLAQTAHDDFHDPVEDGMESSSPSREIRNEEGAFRHDGCTIRHRSDAAARRCTKAS